MSALDNDLAWFRQNWSFATLDWYSLISDLDKDPIKRFEDLHISVYSLFKKMFARRLFEQSSLALCQLLLICK